jgi:small subunit ribosomal protein S9
MPTTKKTIKKDGDDATGETKPVKAPVVKHATAAKAAPTGEYLYARGRRKRAVATIKFWAVGNGEMTVNGHPAKEYFKLFDQQDDAVAPLKAVGLEEATVVVRVSGGGPRGQAEAVRLAVARALLKVNEEHRKSLKKLGFLTRDPREKERKKYGLKKARKAPQWAKR